MSNQCKIIFDHMWTRGPITAKMAQDMYGIQRLASRISDMKKLGIGIKSQIVTGPNRFGDPTHWKEYWLAQ